MSSVNVWNAFIILLFYSEHTLAVFGSRVAGLILVLVMKPGAGYAVGTGDTDEEDEEEKSTTVDVLLGLVRWTLFLHV